MKRKGKFIVFEGIDGSGKSTQLELLALRVQRERPGAAILTFDFPQYQKKSAGMVEEYLSGKYGLQSDVNPYAASVFYAIDRYDISFKLNESLRRENILLSDRYVGSNIGHQGGKIRDAKKREAYFDWLYELEYGIFKVPKPTVSLILNVPPRVARELCNNRERRKKKKEDIHERDLAHLTHASKAYLHAAKAFPKDFKMVECVEGKRLLSRQEVHEKVWDIVRRIL
ncbi:MAG: thymidylate kinase [bacterium]|nr:thymidylate kinase [bacterium]